jgi:hypothetical protein
MTKSQFQTAQLQHEQVPEEQLQPRRLLAYKNVAQTWDFENPCPHCGCIFLHSESLLFRVKCCLSGAMQTSSTFPQLLPLPPQLEYLAVQKINHMTNSSAYYNGALQLGNAHIYSILAI